MPLVRLTDERGRPFGDAFTRIDYTAGPLAGGRVVYVAHNLAEALHPADLLTLAVEQAILTPR